MKIIRSNDIAFINSSRNISYSQFLNGIDSYHSILEVDSQTKVGILMENRAEWLYSFYAVWQKNSVNVPLDYMQSPKELAYILENSDTEFVFYSNKSEELFNKALDLVSQKIKGLNIDKLDIDVNSYERENEKERDFSYDLNELAVIIYTSGTSGKPRGVMLSKGNLLSNLKDLASIKNIMPGETFYTFAPLFHSAGLMGTGILAVFMHCKIIVSDNISPEFIMNTLREQKVNVFGVIPRFAYLLHRKLMANVVNKNKLIKLLFKISRFIDSPRLSRLIFKKIYDSMGGHIRYMPCGGAGLDPKIQKDLAALSINLALSYGMTEASPVISFGTNENNKYGSSGKILPSVQVRIVDKEILVKGPNVGMGYYKDKKTTKDTFKDGWLHTGDLGYVDQDGFLFITGRKKEMIILPNGKNIWPTEVEDAIADKSPIFEEIALMEDNGNLTIVAKPNLEFAKSSKIANIEYFIKDIVSDYNVQLPSYKKISGIKIVNKPFPRTRIGKLRRHLLKDVIEAKIVKEDIADPDIPEYKLLKQHVETTFGISPKPTDHIEIDLNLDSMSKVDLLGYIKATFGFEAKMEDLATYPVFEDLANFVSEKKERILEAKVNWNQILNEDIEYTVPVYKSNWTYNILRFFMKSRVKLNVTGLSNIPKGPCVIVANHLSMLDWYTIHNSMDPEQYKETLCLAKDKLIKSPLKSFISDKMHVVKFNIEDDVKEMLQKIVKILKDGKKLVIFPEGTRSRTGDLNPFRKTFAIVAKEVGVPVLPVNINGTQYLLPPGQTWPKFGDVNVEFLKPINTTKKTYDEIVDGAVKAINRARKKQQ